MHGRRREGASSRTWKSLSNSCSPRLLSKTSSAASALLRRPIKKPVDHCTWHLLLFNGAAPNVLGTSETSALSSIVENENKTVVVALTKAGTDPNLVDRSRVTPLFRAVNSRDQEMVKTLIEVGASMHPPDDIPYNIQPDVLRNRI